MNEFSSEYVFDTLLPSSFNLGSTNLSNDTNLNRSSTGNLGDNKIILMATIMDSLGGITNLTLPVNVS